MSRGEKESGQRNLALWSAHFGPLSASFHHLTGWRVCKAYGCINLKSMTCPRPGSWQTQVFQGLCNSLAQILKMYCTSRMLTPSPELGKGAAVSSSGSRVWICRLGRPHTCTWDSWLQVLEERRKVWAVIGVYLSPCCYLPTWNSEG